MFHYNLNLKMKYFTNQQIKFPKKNNQNSYYAVFWHFKLYPFPLILY